MYQKQHSLACIIHSFIVTLLMLVRYGEINYNAPLSQVVKLQNKAVRVINDVPLINNSTLHILRTSEIS